MIRPRWLLPARLHFLGVPVLRPCVPALLCPCPGDGWPARGLQARGPRPLSGRPALLCASAAEPPPHRRLSPSTPLPTLPPPRVPAGGCGCGWAGGTARGRQEGQVRFPAPPPRWRWRGVAGSRATGVGGETGLWAPESRCNTVGGGPVPLGPPVSALAGLCCWQLGAWPP